MSPLEVDVLLNYSSMKSSLQSMVSNAGKSFKELQASAFDWKNIQDQFDPEQLKNALGLKSLKNKIALSDIIDVTQDEGIKKKLSSPEMLKSLGLDSIKGKISLADLVKNEGAAKIMAGNMGAMNWMPLVSKLFAPANLIAMFSAMAAMGITTALSQQQGGAAGAGGSSLSQSSGAAASPEVTAGAQAVTDVIGTTAGSFNDVAAAFAQILAEVQKYGGTTQDAITLTTQLGEALKATGGTFSSAFDKDFITYLQNTFPDMSKASTDQIEALIGTLESATQASNGQISGIDDAIQKTNDFVRAATVAGATFDGIMSSISRFGAEMGTNAQTAEAMLATALALAQGNAQVAGDLNLSTQQFINLLNGSGGANSAWDTMEQKIANIANTPMLATLAGALQISLAALQGAQSFVTQRAKIDGITDSIRIMNGSQGLEYTKQQWADVLTIIDKIGIGVQGIKNDLSQVITGGSLGSIAKLVADVEGENITRNSTVPFADPSLGNALLGALQTIAKNTAPSSSPTPKTNITVSPIIGVGTNASSLNNAIYGK